MKWVTCWSNHAVVKPLKDSRIVPVVPVLSGGKYRLPSDDNELDVSMGPSSPLRGVRRIPSSLRSVLSIHKRSNNEELSVIPVPTVTVTGSLGNTSSGAGTGRLDVSVAHLAFSKSYYLLW